MTAGAQPRVLIRVWYHDAPSWRSQLLLSKPRVVFVLDLVSLINSLTSGKTSPTGRSGGGLASILMSKLHGLASAGLPL